MEAQPDRSPRSPGLPLADKVAQRAQRIVDTDPKNLLRPPVATHPDRHASIAYASVGCSVVGCTSAGSTHHTSDLVKILLVER